MSQLLNQSLQPLTEPVDLSGLAIPHRNPFLCSITINAELLSETIAHVSNIQYVALIDRAAELAAEAVGYGRNRLLEEDRMWFVGRHEIDYRQEATVGQTLFIATWVRDIRRVKSWRETLMFLPNPDPGARPSKPNIVICQAATLWVLVNLSSRKPISMDQEMIAQFEPVETDTRRPLRERE